METKSLERNHMKISHMVCVVSLKIIFDDANKVQEINKGLKRRGSMSCGVIHPNYFQSSQSFGGFLRRAN